jgi:hypothetical protein
MAFNTTISKGGGDWSVRWYGDDVTAQLRKEIARRLRKATDLVYATARGKLSTTGAGKRAKQRTLMGRKLRKGAKVLGVSRSAPGSPPMRQTGTLQRSLKKKVFPRALRGRVFLSDRKAHLLEKGTQKMAARPFLQRSLDENAAAIASILSTPTRLGK